MFRVSPGVFREAVGLEYWRYHKAVGPLTINLTGESRWKRQKELQIQRLEKTIHPRLAGDLHRNSGPPNDHEKSRLKEFISFGK